MTRSHRRTRQARRGTSLIQMLVVMSLIGVLSSAAISTVVSVMHAEANAAAAMVIERQFSRLTRDWRRDVSASRIVEIARQNELPTVIFTQDAAASRVVTYVAQADRVIRREIEGGTLRCTETYRLPDWSVSFDAWGASKNSTSLSAGKTVRLVCRRPYSTRIKTNTPQPRRDDQVIAVIGRDHRFEKTGGAP